MTVTLRCPQPRQLWLVPGKHGLVPPSPAPPHYSRTEEAPKPTNRAGCGESARLAGTASASLNRAAVVSQASSWREKCRREMHRKHILLDSMNYVLKEMGQVKHVHFSMSKSNGLIPRTDGPLTKCFRFQHAQFTAFHSATL